MFLFSKAIFDNAARMLASLQEVIFALCYNPRIQILAIEELLHQAEVKMPPQSDTFRPSIAQASVTLCTTGRIGLVGRIKPLRSMVEIVRE
jgi:hypothetical protein